MMKDKPAKTSPGKNAARNAHQQRMVNEIRDRFVCSVPWPLLIFKAGDIFHTSPFTMCGSQWALDLSIAIFDNQHYLSVQLANLFDGDIYTKYSLTLKNHINPRHNVSWTDPEGVIVFQSKKTGNNNWGNDEFILVHEIDDREGFIIDKNIQIEVDMRIYGREDINANKALVDAIELANGEHDLIKLANEDLIESVSKLPSMRNIKAQKTQEDHIIVARTKQHHHKK